MPSWSSVEAAKQRVREFCQENARYDVDQVLQERPGTMLFVATDSQNETQVSVHWGGGDEYHVQYDDGSVEPLTEQDVLYEVADAMMYTYLEGAQTFFSHGGSRYRHGTAGLSPEHDAYNEPMEWGVENRERD